MTVLSVLLIAAALSVASPNPAVRIRSGTGSLVPKTPRDGPRFLRRGTSHDRHRIAADMSLFAACFKAGLPALTAADTVADSYGPGSADPIAQRWRRAAALGALGVEPDRAWAEFHSIPGGSDFIGLVTLSSVSGAALAAGCERIAATLREAAADDATAKAERAGVLISIPLTAFFLPAFFVLGLIPAAISIGATLI